jgi:hypothetical protein
MYWFVEVMSWKFGISEKEKERANFKLLHPSLM